jgi:hypothetical protein
MFPQLDLAPAEASRPQFVRTAANNNTEFVASPAGSFVFPHFAIDSRKDGMAANVRVGGHGIPA